MRRALITVAALVLVATSCSSANPTAQPTGNEPDGTASSTAPVDGFAAWPGLGTILDQVQVSDEQQASIAKNLVKDKKGDLFHPNPQANFIEDPRIDLIRSVAFATTFTKAQVDDLFNNTEIPCSPQDLLGTPGMTLRWCPPGEPDVSEGLYIWLCGQSEGKFPTDARSSGFNYEFAGVVEDPDGDGYASSYKRDLFTGASIAFGARYNAEGASVFHWTPTGFTPDDELVNFGIYRFEGGSTTYCGVVPDELLVAAPEDVEALRFRMATFCGTFDQGSADWTGKDYNRGDWSFLQF